MSSALDSADRVLRSLIYDYLCKRGLNGAATALQAEVAAFGEDTSIDLPVDASQSFLFEWFGLFWDMYTARASEERAELSLDAKQNDIHGNNPHSAGDNNIERNEPVPITAADPIGAGGGDHSKLSNGKRSVAGSDAGGGKSGTVFVNAHQEQQPQRWPYGAVEKGIRAPGDAVDGSANTPSALGAHAKQEPGAVDSNVPRGVGGAAGDGSRANASNKQTGEVGGTEMSSSSLFSAGRKRPSLNASSGFRGRKRGGLANSVTSPRNQQELPARASGGGAGSDVVLNAANVSVGAEHSALSGPQGGRPPSRGARTSRNANMAATALAIAQQQNVSGSVELEGGFSGGSGSGVNNSGIHLSADGLVYSRDGRSGKVAVGAGGGAAGTSGNGGAGENANRFSPPHTTSPPPFGNTPTKGVPVSNRPAAWSNILQQKKQQQQAPPQARSSGESAGINWSSELGAGDADDVSKGLGHQGSEGGQNSQSMKGRGGGGSAGRGARSGRARGARGGVSARGGAGARGGAAAGVRRGGAVAGVQRGGLGGASGALDDVVQTALDSQDDINASARNAQLNGQSRDTIHDALFPDQNIRPQSKPGGEPGGNGSGGFGLDSAGAGAGGGTGASASPMAGLRLMNQVSFEEQQLLDIFAGNPNDYSPRARSGNFDTGASLANIDRVLAGGRIPFGASSGGGARGSAGGEASGGGGVGAAVGSGTPVGTATNRISDFMFLNPSGADDVNDVLDSLGGGSGSGMRLSDNMEGKRGGVSGSSALNAPGTNTAKYQQ